VRYSIQAQTGCEDAATGQEESVVTRGLPRGLGERVLWVDDDYAIRRSAKALLEKNGYEVVAAESARMALDIFGAGEAFDVVVTDLTMPGGNGLEVIRAVERLRPDMPVVLVSGFGADGPPEAVEKLGVKEFLAKPFSSGELLGALRVAIDRHEARSR